MKMFTGIGGLDKMLKGGIVQGRNILLSGPCGSGKSTLSMQFLYNGAMKYGEPGLYITLEETKEKFYADMSEFGMDLHEAEKTGRFTLIGGPIAGLRGYMDRVDASIKNLTEEIEEVVKEKKIKRVVIDSVNLLTMLSKDEDERRKALAMISNSLSSLGCTSFFISETKEGSMDLSRYGIEEFVVDGVIVLYLVRQRNKFIPGITVRKMRGTNHDKEIRYYQITNKGVEVYPQETVFTNIR
ncbi:AAA family ATPase [Candidatus Woesearchaeota archaeon]|nr:AAA family ATPase [Candidatus Woesearchaeota archaeon]